MPRGRTPAGLGGTLGRLSRGRVALAAAAAATLGWLHLARERNRRLRPEPIRDGDGRPLPTRTVVHDDGERVELVDAGEGPPVLWIPGADGVKETWRHQLPAFARRYRVLAPDLRTGIGPLDDFDRLARDALHVLDQAGEERAVVVGQSLGGAIAMHFAFRFPERVRGLALCNTLARVSYEHVGLNRTLLTPLAMTSIRYLPTPLAWAAGELWCRTAVWIFDGAPGRRELIRYALYTGPRTVPAEISALRVGLLARTDLRPELRSIRAPTLVVKGPLDTYCPPEWSLDIASRIPGARYVAVAGTGHCCHISDPETFNRVLAGWLREVVEGSRPG